MTFTRLPFLLLFLTIACYIWFYKSPTFLNEYGTYQPEWPLLVDALITIPLACYLCIKDKKQASIKAIAYCALIIFLALTSYPLSKNLFGII